MNIKWHRAFGNYYSDNRKYMIKQNTCTGGWDVWKHDGGCMYSHHVINCDTLRDCKTFVASLVEVYQ